MFPADNLLHSYVFGKFTGFPPVTNKYTALLKFCQPATNYQIISATRMSNIPRIKLIQRGDSTHNQLQVMTLVSLSVINTIVNRPGNPIPPDEYDESAIVYPLSSLKEACRLW